MNEYGDCEVFTDTLPALGKTEHNQIPCVVGLHPDFPPRAKRVTTWTHPYSGPPPDGWDIEPGEWYEPAYFVEGPFPNTTFAGITPRPPYPVAHNHTGPCWHPAGPVNHGSRICQIPNEQPPFIAETSATYECPTCHKTDTVDTAVGKGIPPEWVRELVPLPGEQPPTFTLTVPRWNESSETPMPICDHSCPLATNADNGYIQWCNMGWQRYDKPQPQWAITPDPAKCPGSPLRDVEIECTVKG